MKIKLVLEIENPQDIDDTSRTGLTGDAYDTLVDGLADLGYGIADGPTAEV